MPNRKMFISDPEGGQGCITVRDFPNERPFLLTKAYREGCSAWGVNAKGELFTNLISNMPTRSMGHRLHGDRGRGLAILWGFAKLGVFPKPKLAALLRAQANEKEVVKKAKAAEELLKDAATAGIVLPSRQRQQAQRLIQSAKGHR